ncbi:FeoC-like transcriptional regulator [Algihabitans albus]|uniref:FeoC-like transcriptional regulator n=1 Tax=Algihabitans albus TaxID=2164067 RepID=UPI000E5DA5D2|nr:FeoC-like transcriptional regulator [Algihabitans albus]
MLVNLRDHLRQSGPCTLSEIAAHLDVEPGTAEGLLEVLVRRGDASREPFASHCGGCAGACSGVCGLQNLAIYRAKRDSQSSA